MLQSLKGAWVVKGTLRFISGEKTEEEVGVEVDNERVDDGTKTVGFCIGLIEVVVEVEAVERG
jgi:hypothetical protein